MCEFCTVHGEGKKWYLEMKNYAEELLHQELSSAQEEMVNASTRLEWSWRFFENHVMRAATGGPATRGFMTGRSGREPPPQAEPPEEQIIHDLERRIGRRLGHQMQDLGNA